MAFVLTRTEGQKVVVDGDLVIIVRIKPGRRVALVFEDQARRHTIRRMEDPRPLRPPRKE